MSEVVKGTLLDGTLTTGTLVESMLAVVAWASGLVAGALPVAVRPVDTSPGPMSGLAVGSTFRAVVGLADVAVDVMVWLLDVIMLLWLVDAVGEVLLLPEEVPMLLDGLVALIGQGRGTGAPLDDEVG